METFFTMFKDTANLDHRLMSRQKHLQSRSQQVISLLTLQIIFPWDSKYLNCYIHNYYKEANSISYQMSTVKTKIKEVKLLFYWEAPHKSSIYGDREVFHASPLLSSALICTYLQHHMQHVKLQVCISNEFACGLYWIKQKLPSRRIKRTFSQLLCNLPVLESMLNFPCSFPLIIE